MKFSKLFIIVSLIASLLIGCCSCQEKKLDQDTDEINNIENAEKTYEGFNVYLISPPTDSAYGVSLKTEYELQDKDSFKDYKPQDELTINVRDKNLRLISLNKEEWNSSEFYPVYLYSDGDSGIYRYNPFGKLTGIWWPKNLTSEIGELISDEECIQIAKDIISEYFENSDNFVFESIGWASFAPFGNIEFREFVNGIRCSGVITVNMHQDGTVTSVVSSMIGMIPEGTENPFDMEKVEKAAHERLDEILVNVKEHYDEVSLMEEHYELTMLKNGELAILYRVRFRYYKYYEDVYSMSGDILEFIITQ